MADILIRGMEMPESCLDCILHFSFFRNLHCDKLKGMSGFVGPLPHQNDRHPDCTLVPLPEKHGRLIDADALNLDYEVEMADDWKTAHEIANVVKYAPTIVPAEGGGEDG